MSFIKYIIRAYIFIFGLVLDGGGLTLLNCIVIFLKWGRLAGNL